MKSSVVGIAEPKVGSNFHFGFANGVKTVSLVGKDGKTRYDMVLDGRRDVFIQDNSRFGGGFELRVKDPGAWPCLAS